MYQKNAIETTRKRSGRVTRWIAASTIAFAIASPLHAAKFKALDFWGVGGFAHGSRTAANTLLDSLAKVLDITVDKTDQATAFTAANLAQYQVVIMNNTTEPGKILNVDQRAALLGFMKVKGFVGFHGSGDAKGTWPEYTTFLGGELSSHGGGIATLNIDSAAKTHPIVAGLEPQVKFDEEWYAYKTNPRNAPGVQVLYAMDESTCPGCTKMPGGDHPIAWVKLDPAGGRTFYYAMGHGNSIFQKNLFCINMLKQAITWAAAATPTGVKPSGFWTVEGSMRVTPGPSSLVVRTGRTGKHEVRIMTLDGKLVASRTGQDDRSHTFANLGSGSLYSVVTTTAAGSQSQLVAVP